MGRWYRDCGCQTGGKEGWNQSWRGPLRRGFRLLEGPRCRPISRRKRENFSSIPWAARNEYIQLVLDPEASREKFLEKQAGKNLSEIDQVRALTHLEIQRNAMLMYTSCGWFFTEISGIETVQVLKYAARIFDLLKTLGFDSPEAPFLEKSALYRKLRATSPNSATGPTFTTVSPNPPG